MKQETGPKTQEGLSLLFSLPEAENGKNALFRNTFATVSGKPKDVASYFPGLKSLPPSTTLTLIKS